jgi:hypothetical protein
LKKFTLCSIAILIAWFNCYAQADSFDVFTYTPPEFFTRTAKPAEVIFRMANNDSSICTITIFKSRPAKKTAGKDVASQWKEQVAGRLTRADKAPARILKDKLWDGWMSTLAIGNFYQNEVKSVVMLFSFRKGNKSAFAVFAFSDKIFKMPVETFSQNLHLIDQK